MISCRSHVAIRSRRPGTCLFPIAALPPFESVGYGPATMVSYRVRPQAQLGFIEPCQPRACQVPPSGERWLHEIKHDG